MGTHDGDYMYETYMMQNKPFPFTSFSINDILEYIEEHCFIDKRRLRNPKATGATHLMEGGDIWAGFGRKPNNNLMGWYITFNAKIIRNKLLHAFPNEGSTKFMWDTYANPPYICYYDGATYYSKQIEYLRDKNSAQRTNNAAFNFKIDSDDFIRMKEDKLKAKYGFNNDNRVFKIWASMDFIEDMAHFRIDKDLINPRLLGLINWPYEKPQGLI